MEYMATHKEAAKRRLKEIDGQIIAWDRSQKENLNLDYFKRKKNKLFKKEIVEASVLEDFIALGDLTLAGEYIRVEFLPNPRLE